jgi:flagellar basal body-associated protein FliL
MGRNESPHPSPNDDMLATMPGTPIVVGLIGLAVFVVLFLVLRSRGKAAQADAPRFEPPREIAKRPAKEGETKPTPAPSLAPAPPPVETSKVADDDRPTPTPTPLEDGPELATSIDARPQPTSDVAEPMLEAEPELTTTPPAAPPPLPREGSQPGSSPRPQMKSYSNITDETVAEEVRRESAVPAPLKPVSEPKVAKAPELPKPISEPKVVAKPPPPVPKLPTSEPRAPIAKPASEPKVAPPAKAAQPDEPKVAPAKPTSEPKVTPATKPASEPKVAAKAAQPDEPKKEHDFSALNDGASAPKPAPATGAIAARYLPPSNPATAELEKNDPRHAAARRFARVSVSEIKLYHEDEVKAGREAKDLWKRLQQDIALARQTFEARVVPEVRQRFDYLYDEILRQLAEGDAAKLGPDAPPPPASAGAAPAAAAAAEVSVDEEAPTQTARKTIEPEAPKVEAPKAEAPVTAPPPAAEPVVAAPPPEPKPAPPPPAVVAEAPKAPEPKPVVEAPKPAAPTGLAARGIPSNPETAELEKSDPRHAAARRLARLSVSEIKLYHEDEVKAGREAKDLWKRMSTDIGLALQTYDKRVDKEVRERFDYLYDEILRQLAEGDVTKLGPEAPKPKVKAPEPEPPPAPKAEEPKPAAPAAATPATPAGRYAPPSNPATAELEKNDPRHAAARRLARLSVSEIKLYHEDEVKAGREAKDLWKRMSTDIGLALQTYDKRVDKEVRERFDYLYDEILRQLAEGDVTKLGPEAPKK